MTPFRGKPPHFGFQKLQKYFIFLLYLLTSKISCFQLKRFKALSLEGPIWWGLLIFKPPFFVTFSLFLISTQSKSLIHLPLKLKSSKFWRPHFRKTPNFGNPRICKMLSFLRICLHWKFRVPSMSGKKLQFWQSRLRRKTQFWDGNFFKFYLSLMFILLQHFLCLSLKVKKFEFWRAGWGGNSPLWNSQFF